MAVTTVRSGAPARGAVTPIQKPTSRGVIDQGDLALFVRRENFRPERKVTRPGEQSSYGLGTRVQ